LSADKWCVSAALRDLHMQRDAYCGTVCVITNLLHPTGSTDCAEGDVLCQQLVERGDLPALSKLVASRRRSGWISCFFGDFIPPKPAPNMLMLR